MTDLSHEAAICWLVNPHHLDRVYEFQMRQPRHGTPHLPGFRLVGFGLSHPQHTITRFWYWLPPWTDCRVGAVCPDSVTPGRPSIPIVPRSAILNAEAA